MQIHDNNYVISNTPAQEPSINTPETAIYIGGKHFRRSGKVINVQGVWIELPEPPTKRSIANWNRKRDSQIWERYEYNDVKNKPRAFQDEWINNEFDKIEDKGYWLYINGDPVWLTPQHYYYLNYIRIDIGYPEFRFRDLYLFYFWEACVLHPKCYGMTTVKGRRHGASWMAVGILLRDVTQMREALGGIMSKTGIDAKKFFKRKLVRAYRSLPSFLKPATSSGTNPSTSLDFTTMSSRSKDSMIHREETEEVLDSYIEWRNTAENSFDSEKLYRFVYDEIGKIEERVDLVDQLDTILRTQFDNDMVIGKTFAPSTVNRMDKGGGQFKEVFYAARFDQAEDGETPNGLWGYFIPAYDGYSGTIDKFGRSIITIGGKEKYYTRFGVEITEGAKAKLDRKRRLAKKKGLSALIEEKRKMPYTIEEAFYHSSEDSVLDTGALQTQLDHNESLIHDGTVRGNFVWVNGVGSYVKWVPSENGKFLISWMPPVELQNASLFKNGQRPAHAHLIRGGADPFLKDTTLDGGSKGSFHLRTTRFGGDVFPKSTTVLEYIHRPPLAQIFSDDVLKACVFYGAQVLCESNITNLISYFIDNGFKHYLIKRPKSTYGKNATRATQDDYGIPTASKDVIMQHLESIAIGITEEIGEMEDGQMGDFPFNTTLKQLMSYNLANRTVLDAVVSYGYACWACNLEIKEVVAQRKASQPLVKSYKRGGREYHSRYR